GAPAPFSGIRSRSAISSRSGMAQNYRAAGAAPEWAARPIFPFELTHFDLTFRLTLEKWKAVRVGPVALAVAIVALCLVPAAQAGSSRAFQTQLARALHAKHVSPSRTGAVVFDLQTGQLVFAHNASLPLRPASNEKLATTYADLTALGPSFRIVTDVLGEGQ